MTWLALVPIALLQLTVAVHQFDHVDESADDACYTCGQLDRIDIAVDHTADVALPLLRDFLKSVVPTTPSPRVSLRGFDARAPPTL